MGNIRNATFLFLCACLCFSCNSGGNQKLSDNTINPPQDLNPNDSVELASLIRKLLKWHETDKSMDFDVKPGNPEDSIYTEIDWTAHQNRVFELKKTGFFTKTFLDNYANIASFLDKELKRNQIKYHMGDLPPYGKDVNEWCNCQDYPSDIWLKLTVSNVNKFGDSATFKWSWGDSSSYFVTAKKENSTWRISSLEGFDIKNFSW